MTYETLKLQRDQSVLTITVDRPEALNAQSRLMLEEFDDAMAAAAEDDTVKVIIVAGAGEHFSAGHDIGTPQEREDWKKRPYPKGISGEYRRARDLYLDCTLRWRDCPKPTIAQVQGYCIMGGLMLASACDLIIAAEDASFATGPSAGQVPMSSTPASPGTSGFEKLSNICLLETGSRRKKPNVSVS